MKNYESMKLELLELKWAVAKNFQEYDLLRSELVQANTTPMLTFSAWLHGTRPLSAALNEREDASENTTLTAGTPPNIVATTSVPEEE